MTGDPAARQTSIALWDAMLARYPLGSPLELGRQVAVVAIANLLVVRMVVGGRLQPWELVFLVGLEALLLSAITWVQSRTVPRSALMEQPRPLMERLGTLLFGLFWLVFVYALILGAFLHQSDALLEALRSPWSTLQHSAIRWPLAVTVFGALIDAVADWRHWRSRGGYFLSTPGFNGVARWLTLFLGGIPFLVPMAAVLFAVVGLTERLKKTPRLSSQILAVPALCLAVFGTMIWMLRSGVLGWATGYCSAKLVADSFILFLPLIHPGAHRGERRRFRASTVGSPGGRTGRAARRNPARRPAVCST